METFKKEKKKVYCEKQIIADIVGRSVDVVNKK